MLKRTSCAIVGHDFGAVLAWSACLLHPDRFTSVAALAVPYSPRRVVPPLTMIRQAVGSNFFYMDYFQQPGAAEAEFDRDPARALRAVYYSVSAEGARRLHGYQPYPKNSEWLDVLTDPGEVPAWLTASDFEDYVEEFRRTGFGAAIHCLSSAA